MNEVTIDQICDELGEIRARLDLIDGGRDNEHSIGYWKRVAIGTEEQRDRLQQQLNETYEEGQEARSTAARFERAFRKYAQHIDDCPHAGIIQIVSLPCTCGLDAAMSS